MRYTVTRVPRNQSESSSSVLNFNFFFVRKDEYPADNELSQVDEAAPAWPRPFMANVLVRIVLNKELFGVLVIDCSLTQTEDAVASRLPGTSALLLPDVAL